MGQRQCLRTVQQGIQKAGSRITAIIPNMEKFIILFQPEKKLLSIHYVPILGIQNEQVTIPMFRALNI